MCYRHSVLLLLILSSAAVSGCSRLRHGDAAFPEAQPERLGAELEACRQAHAAQVSREEIAALRRELERGLDLANERARSDAAMRRAMDEYGRGVCLIYGAFTFLEGEGGNRTPLRDAQGNPLELEYMGSGFLADAAGWVLTNRHVVQPWWNNQSVQPLLAGGLTPSLLRLTATFPGRDPVPIEPSTVRIADDEVDMAVFAVAAEGIPSLPLSSQDPILLRGRRVMLMGFPTGLNALLARAEHNVVADALAAAADTESLIRELSRREALMPVVTHGSLNEVTDRKLIYDAITTNGGSGGPVFGPDGRVLGVNFAMVRDFQGSNFGIPIRYARTLLP